MCGAAGQGTRSDNAIAWVKWNASFSSNSRWRHLDNNSFR
jgi:hypothetical protein